MKRSLGIQKKVRWRGNRNMGVASFQWSGARRVMVLGIRKKEEKEGMGSKGEMKKRSWVGLWNKEQDERNVGGGDRRGWG
jgi:hypothetical protein